MQDRPFHRIIINKPVAVRAVNVFAQGHPISRKSSFSIQRSISPNSDNFKDNVFEKASSKSSKGLLKRQKKYDLIEQELYQTPFFRRDSKHKRKLSSLFFKDNI